MSAATIITSIVTGGSNNHATVSEEANAVATDFVTQGPVGTLTNTIGVAPNTGSFAVNQDTVADMGVTVTAGQAYILATPASQDSQVLRARMSANYTAYTINANASGSTKFDWIYLMVNATNAANPDSAADNVASLFTSRSTLSTTDNGSPPTYGILLAVVTVANGASSIANANIADKRTQATLAAPAALTTYATESLANNVTSGCVWTGDSIGSTLNGSMTAGIVYIGGVRSTVSAVSAHPFAASKDTYVYVNNFGVVSYTANTLNAVSPALPANSILLAIITTGASNIASVNNVNQGQITATTPVVTGSGTLIGSDSLGNIIYPVGAASTAKLQNPVAWSVYRNAGWTSANTPAVVLFDAKTFDIGNNVDITTNKGRVTITIPGLYFVNSSIGHPTVTSAQVATELYKNGSLLKVLFAYEAPSTNPGITIGGCGLVRVNVGDYLEIYCLGGAGSTMETGVSNVYFEGHLVSRT